jgi:hypothetical protein
MTRSQNLAPSLCSSRVEDVLLAVRGRGGTVGPHPERIVHGLVSDEALVADLDPQRV